MVDRLDVGNEEDNSDGSDVKQARDKGKFNWEKKNILKRNLNEGFLKVNNSCP